MRQARSLDTYLDSADGLARLAAHADRLLKLQRTYREALREVAADFLAGSSHVANVKLGKIIIHTDSGAVAARLRQMLPSLLDKLCKRGAEITEIQVKVQPNYAAVQHKVLRKAPPVAMEIKAGLDTLANSLPEGSELRQALKNLVNKSR